MEWLRQNPEMNKEDIKSVKNAWILDVDGVICHPQKKKITKPSILDELQNKLKIGEPVILISGRSLKFLKKKIVEPFMGNNSDQRIFANFVVIGEKGGNWLNFDNFGRSVEHIEAKSRVNYQIRDQVKEIVEDQFSQTMFFDSTKKTMVTAEMKDDIALPVFWQQQEQLNLILKKIVGSNPELVIDPSTIATDIQHINMNKTYATHLALDWLKNQQIFPEKFVVFGDSQSDFDMISEIKKNKQNGEFVFVGDVNRLDTKSIKMPFITTKKQFEAGTLEYLSNFS